jgi:hypothetical protein
VDEFARFHLLSSPKFGAHTVRYAVWRHVVSSRVNHSTVNCNYLSE